MNGQWTGSFTGTNTGALVIDLDDVGQIYQGTAFAYDNRRDFPRTFEAIEIPKGQNQVSTTIHLQHIERGTGLFLSDT